MVASPAAAAGTTSRSMYTRPLNSRLGAHHFLAGRPVCSRSSALTRRSRRLHSCVHAKIGFDVRQFEGLVDPEVGFFWTSRILAASLISFIATFTVIPKVVKLKEPESWKEMYCSLIEDSTESIDPEVAAKAMQEGGVLLDVSMESCGTTIDGSVRIPLYQPIEGWSPGKTLRRAGFAAFGIDGTELNPLWLENVEKAVPKDKKLYVIDLVGGSLESKKGLEYGTQSRSLKAVYFLKGAGYQNVVHVKGGIRQWERDDLPVQVAEQSMISSLFG